MAIFNACDAGCGTAGLSRADFLELGYARKKIYCKSCAPAVQAYLVAIDALHVEAAKLFEQGREALRVAWQANHATGSLPDQK